MPGKYFEPARLTTVSGDRLIFSNNDLATHDVKIGGGVFDSGPIGRFTHGRRRSTRPASTPSTARCTPFMSGNLSVVAATLEATPDGVLAGEPLTIAGRAPRGPAAVTLERSVAGGPSPRRSTRPCRSPPTAATR